jgi:peptide/nickel transport system ATP-binding protein
VESGEVILDGMNLLAFDNEQMRSVRGKRISFMASNPRTALDPLATIGRQLGRAVLAHEKLPDARVRALVLDALDAVRLPDAKRRHDAYPHELSVGMAQRVIIALALLHSPEVIIADEPTTGLDVTVQRRVLHLLQSLIADAGCSALVVTHDLGVVAHFCDRLVVMRDGKVVERAPVSRFFTAAEHPYSRQLLEASRGGAADRSPTPPRVAIAAREPGTPARRSEPLLAARDLVKHFPSGRRFLGLPFRGDPPVVRAVNGVSLELAPGEAIGLVGESGSGKTTVGRLLPGLLEPTRGEVVFQGRTITALSQRELRPLRRDMQMVFQEPHASLNPTMTVARNIEQPLALLQDGRLSRTERRMRVRGLLGLVQLRPQQLELYPHHLSSGQAQRVGIARAIATQPRLLVLDEPTSRLDVSVRAGILELLNRIREELRMACVFISHDLAAVRTVCSRIAIMYLGRIVEEGATDDIFRAQRHPYSRALRRLVSAARGESAGLAHRVLPLGRAAPRDADARRREPMTPGARMAEPATAITRCCARSKAVRAASRRRVSRMRRCRTWR